MNRAPDRSVQTGRRGGTFTSRWMNVDAVIGRVEANGGAVLAGSRGVDRAGRVAVIADPTGCVTTLWEPGEFTGCGVMSESGAFAWS